MFLKCFRAAVCLLSPAVYSPYFSRCLPGTQTRGEAIWRASLCSAGMKTLTLVSTWALVCEELPEAENTQERGMQKGREVFFWRAGVSLRLLPG